MPAATAILNRFLHNAEIIAITGRSYRLNRAGEQAGQPPATDQREPDNQPTGPEKNRRQGRRSTAGGGVVSPPEDTGPVTALSSEAGG